MGTFSTNLRNTANSLLTDYGQSVTFSRWSTTEYDVNTGNVSPVTETTFTGVAHPQPYTIDEIDGAAVQQNDIRLLVYTTTEPLIDDTVTLDSIDYRVMNVLKLQAQGEAVVYYLQIRV